MGLQDTFADAVTRSRPPAMFEPQPDLPAAQGAGGPLLDAGPAQPAAPVVVNVTHNPYGSPAAPDNNPLAVQAAADQKWANTVPKSYQGPTWDLQPGEVAPGSPAYISGVANADAAAQEAQRQAFKNSLAPDVQQAFAQYMDGIAQQEAMKQLAAGGPGLFGAGRG